MDTPLPEGNYIAHKKAIIHALQLNDGVNNKINSFQTPAHNRNSGNIYWLELV